MRTITILTLLAAAAELAAPSLAAPVKVVTTLPDLASIAREIGGAEVEATALARGDEDPHYVVARPSLMASVNEADLFVEVGMELELWAERVLDGARNARVRVGAPGHVFASDGVPREEVPQALTRAEGDLHPEGNPHVWTDPLNAKILARNIEAGLERVAPDRTETWKAGLAAFEAKIDERLFGAELVGLLGGDRLEKLARAGKLVSFLREKSYRGTPLLDRLGGWMGRAMVFRDRPIVFYHRSWVYFAERFGLVVAGHVEEKPGIPPSARHREELEALIRARKVPVIGVTSFYERRIPDRLAEATGATVVILPGMTGGVEGATDYFAFMDILVDRLAKAYGG